MSSLGAYTIPSTVFYELLLWQTNNQPIFEDSGWGSIVLRDTKLDKTVKFLSWSFDNAEYPFIAINLKSTLNQNDRTV